MIFVQPGQVARIPGRRELDIDLGIDEGCRGHPCVILSNNSKRNGRVDVLIITSLRDRKLEDCQLTPFVRRAHIPISPCKPHPDHNKLLRLKGDRRLKKKSYVKTHLRLRVELRHLRPFVSSHDKLGYCFTDESLREIVDLSGFTPDLPDIFVDTVNLYPVIPDNDTYGYPAGTELLSRLSTTSLQVTTWQHRPKQHGPTDPARGSPARLTEYSPQGQPVQITASSLPYRYGTISAAHTQHRTHSRLCGWTESTTLPLFHSRYHQSHGYNRTRRRSGSDRSRAANDPDRWRLLLLALICLTIVGGSVYGGYKIVTWAMRHFMQFARGAGRYAEWIGQTLVGCLDDLIRLGDKVLGRVFEQLRDESSVHRLQT